MKKLFSLLAMAAMVFTACQNDEGVKNPTLADEGIVNLSVGVPELATRALDGDNQSGADSAYGAIDYANYTAFLKSNYDVRFQLAVYEAGADVNAEPVYTATNYVDFASTTNFNDLRFVPGREYQFVLFADFVPQGSQEDFRYNTADLRNITAFEPLNAMDETYDAYFFNKTIKVEAGKINELEAVLKRPFGKVRVLTTDLAFVEKYAMPAEGEVTFYNHAIYKSFNAVTGEVTTEATNAEETHRYAIDTEYYGATQYEGKEACTLFATYVLATNAQEALNFRLDTFEADGSLIKSLDFNTEIPYQRNHLTTLVGNLLTNEADLFVRIDDNFDAEHFEKGDFENVENGLKWIREGELVAGDVYEYETNLFTFRLFGENGATLRAGTYDYTEELLFIQNAKGFDIDGIDVEKGTLTITDRGTRAENYYDVVFDIYATIDGKTENYILTWNGALKAAREPLAEPVVTYEVDEVDALHITFSWEAVENAANYTVKWNEEEQTVEGTSATFDFSGEDTYATAYVTANPANADDYTASTGSVTVDWKKPIDYQPIAIELAGIDEKDGAHFYSIMEGLDLTISVPNYPDLKDAWYQVAGYLPTPFSAEADLVETVGSAAGVVIYEPNADVDKEFDGPEAYAFTYEGAMNPYILTKAEVNWLAGYNTVKVKFSNEAGTAIEFQTSAPMEAGHETIEPSYVAVDGDQNPNIKTAEMNVLLDDKGTYTVFFKIDSLTYDVLMQYVGAIDFEKPYAPQYVLESYTAGAETIYFESENAEFEIEATSLESGDVVVKKLILDGSDDYVASNQVTAATAVVKEENGVYDARYTVTVKLPIVGAKTFDLQYVGPFVPYSAPVEPEEAKKFTATWVVEKGSYIFTGVEYNFTIIIKNLATTTYYTGDSTDAWAYEWTLGQPMNNFRTGDFLTVENNVVTLEFTAASVSEEYRYKMVVDMNEEPAEPEEITVELAYEKNLYVGGNYQIDYVDKDNYTIFVTNHKDGDLPATVKTSTVYDDPDELVFEFVDTYNNAKVTAIYNRFGVDPNDTLEIMLALDEETGYLVGSYEDTVYTIMDDGNDFGGTITKGNEVRRGIIITVTDAEDGSGKYYTFYDELNNRDVRAFYQTSFGPVDTTVNVTFTKIADGGAATDYTTKFNLSDEAGNKVSLVVDNRAIAAGKIVDGNYTWISSPGYINNKSEFSFNNKSLTVNGATFANADIAGTMTVVDGKITLNMSIFEVAYVLVYTPSNTPVEPEWTNVKYDAVAAGVSETGFAKYTADIYTVAGEQWSAGDRDGKAKYTVVDGLHTWEFDDDVLNRHVTIEYKEAGSQPEVPESFENWVFTASLNMGTKTITMTDGTHTVTAVLNLPYLSTGTFTTASNQIIFNDGANANGSLTLANNGYVTLDVTIDGVKYTGTSTNTVL